VQFDWKRAALRALRIVVALAIGGAALGVVSVWIVPDPSSRVGIGERGVWREEPGAVESAGFIRRELRFFVGGTQLRASQRLRVEQGAALCALIDRRWRRMVTAPQTAPLDGILGTITVERRWLRFERIQFTVDPDTPGSCTLTADVVPFALFADDRVDVEAIKQLGFEAWLFNAHETRVAFETDGVTVMSMSGAPIAQDERSAQFVWKQPVATGSRQLEFRIQRPAREAERRAVRAILSSADRDYLPVATPVVRALLLLLPYALLVWLRSKPRLGRFEPYFELATALLLVFLVLECAQFVVHLLVLASRARVVSPYFRDIERAWHGAGAIAAAFAGVCWLVLAMRRKALAAHPARPITRFALVTAVASIIAFAATAFFWRPPMSGLWIIPAPMTANIGAVITVLAACIWIIAELTDRHRVWLGVLLAAGACGVAVAQRIENAPLIAQTIAVMLAASFFFGIVVLVRRTFFAHARWPSQWIVAAGMFVLAWLVVEKPRYGIFGVLRDVAVSAEPLTALMVVASLVLMLHALSKGQRPSMTAQVVGYVLALAGIFRSGSGFYNAVVIVAAAILLQWLFERRKTRIVAEPQAVREAVRAMITASDAERASDAMRRALLKKLAAGESKWPEYESAVKRMEVVADRKRAEADAHPLARVAFANGPLLPSWERGLVAARYAVILAIPWFLLFFSDLTEPSSPTWWLSSIAVVIRAGVQWPLMGFFFGYFYPVIRGNNGLAKSLVFFGAIVVPALIALFLFRGESGPPSTVFVFWFLQLFIQSVVVGVMAGDYLLLQHAGLRWRHLRDVHNLGVLTAYGSSVLVAIGAALSTTIAKDGMTALFELMRTWSVR
jgi:hypothetical protein